MPRGKPEAPLIDRFMSRVNKEGPSVSDELGPCWDWTGNTLDTVADGINYGRLLKHVWGEWLTHRWSYIHHVGEIPEGKMVRHRCDRRCCVNPAHLELGDSKDNVGDMIVRNPKAFGRKITTEQIPEILALRVSGLTYKAIAERYSVNRRTIEKLCLGKKCYYKKD